MARPLIVPEPARLSRPEKWTFTGRIAILLEGRSTATATFTGGSLYPDAELATLPTEIRTRLREGDSLGKLLAILPKSAKTRIDGDTYRVEYLLPRDAAKLSHFSGTLSGSEFHWSIVQSWDLEVRDGRVVEIHEEDYDF